MKVYKSACKNCLLTSNRLVSPARAKAIIEQCKQEQMHFTCHAASISGQDICCHNFYQELGHYSQAIRIMERLDRIEFVEQPQMSPLISYEKQQQLLAKEN